jgi:N-acetylglucosaminyl-diphospho-decaprenol L-rhamnosyltransferase
MPSESTGNATSHSRRDMADRSGKEPPGAIYVVVPVFNRRKLIERFLECMRRQSITGFETIVVDDGSTDGTSELIRTTFPEVVLLRGDSNLWWTGAINKGIQYAMAKASNHDAILVINDDVEVDPWYLETIRREWLTLPDTLIGSVVVDIDRPDLICDGGTLINWWTAKVTKLNRGMPVAAFGPQYRLDVSVLSGRGVLIPVHVFRKVGIYNDRHYQQSGDEELPVRAKKAGYRLKMSYDCMVKGHTKTSYGLNVADAYSVKDIRKYFFDVRSNRRLRSCAFFAYDTAANPFAFVSFLFMDLTRNVVHFVRRLRFDQKSAPINPTNSRSAVPVTKE